MSAYLHRCPASTAAVLANASSKWPATLPPAPYLYENHTDGFGIEIRELLLCRTVQERVENILKSTLVKKKIWEGFNFLHTAENMKAIAEELGISIKQPDDYFYPRDLFLRLPDGSIRMPHFSLYLPEAIERTHSSNLYLDLTAATRTKNQLFNSWAGYSQLYTSEAEKAYRTLFNAAPQHFDYSYLEGGNVFFLKNGSGTTSVLIGRDHLTQTLHLLELEGRSWEELAQKTFKRSFSSLRDEHAQRLSPAEVRRATEEMFAEGALLQQGKSGIIDKKHQLQLLLAKFMSGPEAISRKERGWLCRLGQEAGLIPQFNWQESEISTNTEAAAGHLAKRQITRHLIANDLKVSPTDLYFLTQVNYHLDLFLRPGPNSTIFLISFKAAKVLLDALDKAADFFALSPADREHLKQYCSTAEKLDEELGPLLDSVEAELVQAGFKVLPLPGHFLYETKEMHKEFAMPTEGWNINFINALSGWSAKTGKQYYITHGLQVGDHLGKAMMDAFAFVLDRYIPGLEVYFIGRNPADLTDFSEAMDWWNRLETQSGVHCATFPLSTAACQIDLSSSRDNFYTPKTKEHA